MGSMDNTFPTPPPPVSRQTFVIGGILCTVYGLEELETLKSQLHAKSVACLWLLHPRLQKQACMAPVADTIIGDWNKKIEAGNTGYTKTKPPGLIAVAFDQRNHGTRLIDNVVNETWRKGNERHAQDMFSMYQGTASDTFQLIDLLPSYIFPTGEHTLTTHMTLGVSLGGHAAWHTIIHHPSVRAAIVTIGCPDYVRVMSDRARLSKRESYISTDPPGSVFLGSADFPYTLVEMCRRWDPAAYFLSRQSDPSSDDIAGGIHITSYAKKYPIPPKGDRAHLRELLSSSLKNKRILCLSGGSDKLVPYRCTSPFLSWLKRAVGPDGWWSEGGVVLEDFVYEEAGHEVTQGMVGEMVRFVAEALVAEEAAQDGTTAGQESGKVGHVVEAKI